MDELEDFSDLMVFSDKVIKGEYLNENDNAILVAETPIRICANPRATVLVSVVKGPLLAIKHHLLFLEMFLIPDYFSDELIEVGFSERLIVVN